MSRPLSCCLFYWANLPQSLNSSTDSSSELAAVVDDLLNQLNSKFTSVSNELLAKSTCLESHFDAAMADCLFGRGITL